MITNPVYCTREAVKAALDIAETARSHGQIDRAVEAAAENIEGLCHRKFLPWTGTRYFDWPDRNSPVPWRLWLDENTLISVTSITSGGVEVSEYFLEPANDGPPYDRIEVDRSSSSSFTSGSTPQRSIAVTGVWGYTADTASAGALAEDVDASETDIDVTDVSSIGVGTVLKMDSERVIVGEKTFITTGTTLSSNVDALNSVNYVDVGDGTSIHAGEVIQIDTERMLVFDVIANRVYVKRGWDGTVLAAHTSTTAVYAPRRLSVTRAALGTTAATHSNGASVLRQRVPVLIEQLAVAEAISSLMQEQSGYGRVIGAGESQMEASGKGLRALRDDVYRRYGRKARHYAV